MNCQIVILNKVKNPFVYLFIWGSLFVQNDFTFVIGGFYFGQPFTFIETNQLITKIFKEKNYGLHVRRRLSEAGGRIETPGISGASEDCRCHCGIAEARDKGDLSENAEYDAAKEAQGMLEMKINQLKATIGDAKIIDTSKLKTDTVQILSRVELKNVKTGMKMAYTIVSESEANLKQGKISVNTPIAQGLLGKKVGDIAEITIPQGKISLEITGISF